MNLIRKYRYPDARLLELAGIIQSHFEKREALFVENDPKVSAAWLRDIIAPARKLTLDDFERGVVGRRTEELLASFRACHKLVRRLRYYINVAFDEASPVKREFSLRSYSHKRRKQIDYIAWLERFVLKVQEYRSTLEAAGAGATHIDKLISLVGTLGIQNNLQELRKELRASNTQERIDQLNLVYAALKRLESLAELVYDEEERDLQLFILPTYTASGTAVTDATDASPLVSDGDDPPAGSL